MLSFFYIKINKGIVIDCKSILIIIFFSISLKVPAQNEVNLMKDSLIHQLETSIYFENNSFVINEDSKAALHKFIDTCKNKKLANITLEGHTNNIGSQEYNFELSENRVNAVYQFLSSNGIDSTMMEKKSFGPDKPKFDNKTEEGKSLNRRVDIKTYISMKLLKVSGIIQSGEDILANTIIYAKNKIFFDSTYTDANGRFEFYLPHKVPISIYSLKEGWFNTGTIINPNISKREEIRVTMMPLKVNAELKVSTLLYVSNKNILLPASKPILDNLVRQFKVNSKYCFEIQGHVNAPGYLFDINTHKYMTLSMARAGMVYFHFVNNGIDEKRMVAHGYGHTKMLYKNNPSESEQQQNRRVVFNIMECSKVEKLRLNFNKEEVRKYTYLPEYSGGKE